MLVAWAWRQLVHEIGICVAFLVVVACAAYLARKVRALSERESANCFIRGLRPVLRPTESTLVKKDTDLVCLICWL